MAVGSEREMQKSAARSPARRVWDGARREPLFHFVLLAGLLFIAEALWSDDEREVIIVDTATQDFLIQQQSDLLLRPLTDAERREVIESFVEDEVLVREAKKRGFTDSSRIRALLIQNMRFFVAGDLVLPTEDDLRAHFEANRETFERPPSLDLEHAVYLDPTAVPDDVVARLDAGMEPKSSGNLGPMNSSTLRFMDRTRLVSSFGSNGARAILAIENGGWNGPIRSPDGAVHFVRVAARHAPSLPEFEEVKGWIEAEWLSAKTREIMDREVSLMKENYRIVVEPAHGAGDG